MQYPEAVQYLYSLGNEVLTAKLGLHNISTLLGFLGDPQKQYPSVLIAGTNGKGSVAAFIESALRAAGFKTGLYTSPHLICVEERIQVCGAMIGAGEFARLTRQAKEAVAALLQPQAENASLDRHPTYFEMVTAIAFQYFAERHVDLAVLEVGLGGRLDATNVTDPLVAVITNVDYDHQKYLGSRLEEIAFEKAGIIKTRSKENRQPLPVVCASTDPQVRSIIEARCNETRARCSHVLDNLSFHTEPDSLGRFRLKMSLMSGEPLDICIPLPGEHQVWNALTAIRTIELLHGEGIVVQTTALKGGLEAVRWPGRLEFIDGTPPVILDGAHNPAGAECLRSYCEKFLSGKRIVLIFGAMRDKAIAAMAGSLFPLAQAIVLTAALSDRSAAPEEIAAQIPMRVDCHVARSPQEALGMARQMAGQGSVILVAGSLFLVGDIRRLLSPALAA